MRCALALVVVLALTAAFVPAAEAQALGSSTETAVAAGWINVECRSFTWKATKGTWPSNQKITQATTWCRGQKCKGCALKIVSHRSTDGFSSGPLCDIKWGPATWVSAGGVGYWSVTKKTKAVFSCGPPQLKVSSTVIIHVWYNAWLMTGIK